MTRGIIIRRIHTVEEPDGKGGTKQVKKHANFPCKINKAVPFDHRMNEFPKFDW